MPKLVLAVVLFVHGMRGNRSWDKAAGVISQLSTRSMETLLVATSAITLVQKPGARENNQSAVQKQILLTVSSSWGGEPYQSYPSGQPELSAVKITLAPRTQLEWHRHPMPSAAYIVAGELTLVRKRMARSNTLRQSRRVPRQLTHSIEEWQRVNLLY